MGSSLTAKLFVLSSLILFQACNISGISPFESAIDPETGSIDGGESADTADAAESGGSANGDDSGSAESGAAEVPVVGGLEGGGIIMPPGPPLIAVSGVGGNGEGYDGDFGMTTDLSAEVSKTRKVRVTWRDVAQPANIISHTVKLTWIDPNTQSAMQYTHLTTEGSPAIVPMTYVQGNFFVSVRVTTRTKGDSIWNKIGCYGDSGILVHVDDNNAVDVGSGGVPGPSTPGTPEVQSSSVPEVQSSGAPEATSSPEPTVDAGSSPTPEASPSPQPSNSTGGGSDLPNPSSSPDAGLFGELDPNWRCTD